MAEGGVRFVMLPHGSMTECLWVMPLRRQPTHVSGLAV